MIHRRRRSHRHYLPIETDKESTKNRRDLSEWKTRSFAMLSLRIGVLSPFVKGYIEITEVFHYPALTSERKKKFRISAQSYGRSLINGVFEMYTILKF